MSSAALLNLVYKLHIEHIARDGLEETSSEGSTVAPMVLSLAIFNNLVLTMSSQTGKTLAKRRAQKLETLHYYVLTTLFPLLGHLED